MTGLQSYSVRGITSQSGESPVTNNGAQPASALVINDATAAFTTFVSAACPATLPAGVTSCTVSAQPAVGASGQVQWTFGGALGASASLAVTYQVKIGG